MDFARVRAFREDIRREFAAVDSGMDALAKRKERLGLLIQNLDMILSEVEVGTEDGGIAVLSEPTVGAGAGGAAYPDGSQEESRPAMIAEILDNSGTPVATADICAKLREQGDGAGAVDHDFWRTVDSVLRKGRKRWGFRRTGKAMWTRPDRPAWSPHAHPSFPLSSSDSPLSNGRASKPRATLAASAEEILRRVGHPLTTNDVMQRLRDKGYDTPAERSHFYNSVYSAMRRSAKFRKFDKGVWGLADATMGERDLFKDDND